MDTLRADHLGSYGYEPARTPHIDALAARGLRFTQAVTPLPRTTPAIASLLTGLWPIHHGSREVGDPMKALPTLASELKANGYATVGVACNANLGRRQRIHLGFDAYVAKAMGAGAATDEALRLLEGVESTKPLFLWVHYFDPHMPYRPPRDWRLPPKVPDCGQMFRIAEKRGYSKGQLTENRDGIASGALASCLDLYDAEISYTDHQIGRLLTTLEEARPGAEPLVVFTADHGENLGEAGLFYEHGPNVHDASLHVPLIIAGPTVRIGTDDAVFRLEDLMPTLLSLLGLPGGDAMSFDGVDLSSRLGRWAWLGLQEEPIALAESGSALQVKFSKSLVTGRRRGFNCLHHGAYSLCQRPGEAHQLFNHDEDPGFTVDLREAEPDSSGTCSSRAGSGRPSRPGSGLRAPPASSWSSILSSRAATAVHSTIWPQIRARRAT